MFSRSLPECSRRVVSEFYEFTPFQRFPFLRTGQRLECWAPAVFFRGMEAGSEYIQPFSRIFEDHVRSQLADIGVPMFSGTDLRAMIGHGPKLPDALISFPRSAPGTSVSCPETLDRDLRTLTGSKQTCDDLVAVIEHAHHFLQAARPAE